MGSYSKYQLYNTMEKLMKTIKAGGGTENLFLSPPNLPYRRGGT